MNRPKYICLKRVVIGFAVCSLAVTVTVWAMMTYVPQSSPIYFAIGAAFATFYCMSFTMRASIHEAYRAGEVGRRLPSRRSQKHSDRSSVNARSTIAARTIFSADDDPALSSGQDRELVRAAVTED